MSSETEIANMALSHLGIGKEIANLDTEKSQEAGACRRYYDLSRDTTLSAFNWPFARKFAVLSLVQDNTAATIDQNGFPEWRYYYAVPADCLNVHRILSGSRNDSRQTRVPFLLVQGASGGLIYCDQQNAEIEYTASANDPTLYSPDFTLAFTFRLAHLIAPRVTGGDNFQIGDRALKQFEMLIDQAKARALNQEQVPEDSESEFIRSRGGYAVSDERWIDRVRGGF